MNFNNNIYSDVDTNLEYLIKRFLPQLEKRKIKLIVNFKDFIYVFNHEGEFGLKLRKAKELLSTKGFKIDDLKLSNSKLFFIKELSLYFREMENYIKNKEEKSAEVYRLLYKFIKDYKREGMKIIVKIGTDDKEILRRLLNNNPTLKKVRQGLSKDQYGNNMDISLFYLLMILNVIFMKRRYKEKTHE